MRFFVTGATGYIGTALCRRLVGAGHEVRALVRATSRTEELHRLGVTTFVGDLGDRPSMREGMSGADWVVHAAAELEDVVLGGSAVGRGRLLYAVTDPRADVGAAELDFAGRDVRARGFVFDSLDARLEHAHPRRGEGAQPPRR